MYSSVVMRGLAGCVALALAAVWPARLAAQYDEPPPPAAYALKDVTLVRADGSRLTGVTMVVRGAFIEALGPGIEAPPDAQVLEGDSLVVYPGLVDAQGEAAYEFPRVDVDQSELEPWNPPRHVQGFLPHRRVADYLTATGGSTQSQRTKGVVAAAVYPTDALMPGRATLVLFRKGAATPDELVLSPALGAVMTFRGARGAYPGTLFGVIAFQRQAFEDAQRHGRVLIEYERDPRGLTAPRWDPDYAVLREVMNGGPPVLFAADSAEDIRRMLSLADEYGFRPVLVGGAAAWRVADQLRARDIPVLVSLDFPEPKRWKPDEKAPKPDSTGTAQAAKAGTAKPDTAKADSAQAEPAQKTAGPLDAAAQREKEWLEDAYANAGRLAAAGVRFALTSGGGKADIREGARKVIEHGLAVSDALPAVTATPAALLGAPHLTRIEPGMAATFIVTDGPLFAEESKVVYTFVEGALEKGGAARKAGGGEAPVVTLTGEWSVDVSSDQGTMSAKLRVEQTGAQFTGTMDTEFGPMRITSGTVSGNGVTFTGVLEAGGERVEVQFTGTVTGDQASGTGSSPFGALSWKATRTSGGPGEEALQ